MEILRRLFHLKGVSLFLYRLFRSRLKWYCRIYGHDFKVSIDKPKMDPTVHHTLYCGRCNEIYGWHNVAYMVYNVKGVNPVYGNSLQRWLEECGMGMHTINKLIANLQKFRTQATRPDVITRHKEKRNDDHTPGEKTRDGELFRVERVAHGKRNT